MTTLLWKRLSAFAIDYIIIITYALLLFLFTHIIFNLNDHLHFFADPYKGQLIGFCTLTLPVFLYFFITEKSTWQASIGKRSLKLRAETSPAHRTRNILIRNILKWLPWEIAHTGVHWIVYYSDQSAEAPLWVWMALIIPQVIVAVYLFSILLYRGESSIYDKIAKTKIVSY